MLTKTTYKKDTNVKHGNYISHYASNSNIKSKGAYKDGKRIEKND